jgi:hypothetical protein
MITAGVPLPLVSKALRHSQVSITSDLYGHLTREAAHAAADGLRAALDAAAAEFASERAMRDHDPRATTLRPHHPEAEQVSGNEEGARDQVSAGQDPSDDGAPSGTRTPNPVIKSHLLCPLS